MTDTAQKIPVRIIDEAAIAPALDSIPAPKCAALFPDVGMAWKLHVDTPEGITFAEFLEGIIGIIPELLSAHDERPMAEQLNETYLHGGGWRPQDGYVMGSDGSLTYGSDRPYRVLASTNIRDETLFIYDSAVAAIVQRKAPTTFEVSRLD